ncbi:MAG: hypothetical protein CMN34_05360 [Saprospirales bacterium]|nr:hypothetical protein [Saprospirales bacterium]
MYISTNLREDYNWNPKMEEWKFVSSDDEELTFFEFNADFTMFTHTTPSITSSYLVKETLYDEESDQYEFDVVSDVGNKYLCILDLEQDNIRFIGNIGESNSWLVRHSIKKLWLEEE